MFFAGEERWSTKIFYFWLFSLEFKIFLPEIEVTRNDEKTGDMVM